MIHNWSKVGGSVQLNRFKALMVSVKNPLHAVTVRVLNVAILREKNKSMNCSQKGNNIKCAAVPQCFWDKLL